MSAAPCWPLPSPAGVWPPGQSPARLLGVACIIHKQMQMVAQPIVLQPRQHGVKLGNRHHSPTLVAQHAFENGVVAVVEPLPSSNGVSRKSTHSGGTAL